MFPPGFNHDFGCFHLPLRPVLCPHRFDGFPLMKALVTGGAGFIGSHLAEALARRGASVVILDLAAESQRENLAWIRPGDGVEVVTGDVGDASLLKRLVPGTDWILHHAAMPSVPRSVALPAESNAANLDATLTLLLAAREARVQRFLFASSSSIYGDSEAPAKHEGLPPQPLSPYALQKYAAERYGQLFHRLYGVPAVSLRYFNVFGPRQAFDSAYSGVIARFCTAFLKNEPSVLFGDGLQSRDFTHIGNVVEGNLLALEAPESRVAGRVFNIACGRSITLLQLVADLSRLTGRTLAPRFEPARAGDIQHSLADISAAREQLGYSPKTDWETGLQQTLAWYRTRQLL